MKKLIWLTILFVCVSCPPQIFAGDSSAVLGTEDFFAGALPPPGFHFINYLAYYSADELKDNNSDKVPVDFKANLVADCFRGIYVSDIKVLGADLAWHVIVPLVYKRVEIKGTPGGMGDFDENRASIGDIYFSPFVLGWHSELFHFIAGMDIIAPTGQYNKNRTINIGNNHWTFEPAFAVSMIHPSGVSASVKLMYDFHTENDDTKLETGQQFHLDYNVGLLIIDSLRLGICGYYLKGVQEDKLNGTKVPDSKEQVLAVGPSAMYSFSPALHLVAKLQYEMEAENRPEGMFGWLKLLYSF